MIGPRKPRFQDGQRRDLRMDLYQERNGQQRFHLFEQLSGSSHYGRAVARSRWCAQPNLPTFFMTVTIICLLSKAFSSVSRFFLFFYFLGSLNDFLSVTPWFSTYDEVPKRLLTWLFRNTRRHDMEKQQKLKDAPNCKMNLLPPWKVKMNVVHSSTITKDHINVG